MTSLKKNQLKEIAKEIRNLENNEADEKYYRQCYYYYRKRIEKRSLLDISMFDMEITSQLHPELMQIFHNIRDASEFPVLAVTYEIYKSELMRAGRRSLNAHLNV